jgi:hypothetical protein
MVWIFQDGHLASALRFTPTPTNTAMPVLLFCIAFGLSMDYETFVISRIKELHDAGFPNAYAVTHGLARVGRIVSTAAALLAVSFFAFGTSRVSFIQFFRHRHRAGDPDRRDPRARNPGPGVHARLRRGQLVRAPPAAPATPAHQPEQARTPGPGNRCPLTTSARKPRSGSFATNPEEGRPQRRLRVRPVRSVPG